MRAHVHLIDDDPAFRASVADLLASIGTACRQWGDPDEILAGHPLERPGCVVVDYRLPGLSGIEVLKAIRRRSTIPTILISAYADVRLTVAAMHAGAASVFEKPFDDNEFLSCIERTCFFDRGVWAKIRECRSIRQALEGLTEGEKAVLKGLRSGKPNKILAYELGKSVKAVERYRQALLQKLGCGSIQEAVLQSLAREAAMVRLRRIFPAPDFGRDDVPEETLEGLAVAMPDFQEALATVEPSAIREVFTEIPDVRWDQIGGLGEIRQILEEAVQWPLRYPDLFRAAGISPPRGILLNGPPGVGKTMLAKALATESGVNFISVKGPALTSKWFGDSERAIREVFHKAKLAAPCILFLDEIDSIAPRRGGGDAAAASDRMIAQLLTEMDGVEELRGVLVLAATNRKDLIDPALLRPGRFDLVIDLPLPDRSARLGIYRVHTKGKRLAPDVDLDALAAMSDGSSGADIALHCCVASTAAVREFLAHGYDPTADVDRLLIEGRHFARDGDGEGPPG